MEKLLIGILRSEGEALERSLRWSGLELESSGLPFIQGTLALVSQFRMTGASKSDFEMSSPTYLFRLERLQHKRRLIEQ